ncbi:hypothetical protein COV53_00590 [Candidatus Gottesmanbacteria bacterium CG11_big_fil_rev_8_21_14_0_20_37_11]|uniref:Uncharacterized protein n=3 Tax=Candidatus Gottesmaniibacteriota TaxID=1752720 RepID=A0A2M7RQ43_9BACT|nr:MAG: hypothetical protein AUJ73_01175 [Candidatus Gottesmanbacteria bacterium CG1_02_37_22]PIP32989.1 MAG: hypothetical protein COX23_01860 [Candidatus Gottesmanbacteria bacterium CG23_combo_of_CG06-09_8_20_14_all_37_19]PIR08896.1 MAG: hypothetical protein COV53_00590 [Candidatus Gottesmanbacteria bacterium CG11_big_fil_rev_8_21_14_0_20_37_11]PIZ02382.1 MAG: hypothetical protein COY59_05195 [Candidatus Gottesmanbacteria bacterium CG_4_10_14_0_8_um_filter_37_24]
MKSLLPYEILLVLGTLISGEYWLFFLALGYVLVSHKRLGKTSRIVLAAEQEAREEEELNIHSKENPAGLHMPDLILPYKSCVIEVYGGLKDGSTRIMTPSGKDLGKEFESIDDAIREIDVVAPFLKPRNIKK